MPDMLAALWNGVDTVDVKSVPRPVPGPDDALVKVTAEGICGSDLNYYRRLKEPETVPGGHETAGEVVEVGARVDPSLIGQRVAVEVIGHGNACLACWYCRQGQYTHCTEKRDWGGGGFAEYVTRRAAACYPLDESMTWEEGALVEPLAVSIRGLHRGGLAVGDTVVVLGAGNIGLTAVAPPGLWERTRSSPQQGTRTRPSLPGNWGPTWSWTPLTTLSMMPSTI